MYDLTAIHKTTLNDIWDKSDNTWFGPEVNEYFSANMERVEPFEYLMGKNLLAQGNDPKGIFRLRFLRDGFFYLDEVRQKEATKWTNEVITAIRRLYPKKKGAQATMLELAQESGLSVGDAFRALYVLTQFGLSISANLENGPASPQTFLTPGPQIAKVTTYEALFEQRMKEHDSYSNRMKHWEKEARSETPAPVSDAYLGNTFDVVTQNPPGMVQDESEKLTAAALYQKMVVHPDIRRVSEKLFNDGHYSNAILDAFKALNILVKQKSGRTELDGRGLMGAVFTDKNPTLKLNSLLSESDRNEQEGFMLIFMGVMVGIRNPKAHEIVEQKDPIHTLQYLALADLLARRVEESTK